MNAPLIMKMVRVIYFFISLGVLRFALAESCSTTQNKRQTRIFYILVSGRFRNYRRKCRRTRDFDVTRLAILFN